MAVMGTIFQVLMLSVALAAADGPAPDGAVFVSQTPPPTRLAPGKTAAVVVTMTNSGAKTWTAAAGYKLGAQSPPDNQAWRAGRVVLGPADAIKTGQRKNFSFTITAPATEGTYSF